MNSAHSSSSFRGTCVIAPRHPKTRLPTTAIERKSFDFSSLNQHQNGSLSDETSGTSSNENGKATTNSNRKNSQLRRTKSSKRPNSMKKKTLSKSDSKSVTVGCEPQGINNSRFNSKRLIDMKSLSVDDDLFFRHLQALKEENKRALKTLERLYKFGQEEENNSNKNVNITNKKNKINKGTSDEGITSDSNASRHSQQENGHAGGNLNTANTNTGDMPAESIEGNYIYELNGDRLLKVAETDSVYSQNGYGGNDRRVNSNVDNGYAENGKRNGNLENIENNRRSLNLENGYGDINRRNIGLENGYGDNDRRNHNLENGYNENNRWNNTLEKGYAVHDGHGGNYRRHSINLGNGIPHDFRHGIYSNQVNRDYIADMDREAMEDRERHHASDSSEDELDAQLKVKPPSSHVNILPEDDRAFRGRQSNYDVIANMWNNFSVNDTVPYTRNGVGRRGMRKKQGWSPGVTIPEPFKMTTREEKMKEMKQKKVERIKDELLQKKLEDEAELKKRVTPIPIPPSTFLPIFSEKQQQEQQKKQQMKEISKHILKSTEKPFSFLEREEAKNKIKRSQSMNAKIGTSKNSHFKANPYPDKLFDLTWKDKEAEQAEYRKIKIKLRSQELLASSSLPPSMKTRGDLKHHKNDGGTKKGSKSIIPKKKKKEKVFQPQVHHSIPDFQEMQKKIEMALEARKNQNTPTICEPFNLHTAQIPSRRSKFNDAVEKSKSPNTPPHRPGSSFARSNTITGREGFRFRNERRPSSCVGLTRSRSTSVRSGRLSRSRSVSPVYSVTEAARLRHEHIRQSVEKEKQEQIKQNEEKKQKQKEISKLQKVVAQKTAAHDPSRFRERQTAEKLASFRRAEKERVREYKEFLKSVEQKNEQRPLLFERESQTNAKRQAQKRYEEILRRAGIDGKTLEAFIAGDRDIHRQLQEATDSEEDDSDEDEDEDIPLKADGQGYDVVLKSNNNSRSYENNSEGEFEAEEIVNDNDDDEDDDDDDEEEDDEEEDDDDEEDDDEEDDAAAPEDGDDGDDDDDDDDDGNDVEENGDPDGARSNNDGDVESDDGSYKP